MAKHGRAKRIKLQSAMEYLMTYGWAILIIAVVLGALFQLGVFSGNNFAPKAPPGACQVFRPSGPGTTSFMNLEGECQGELPEYVAQFNGQNSYIYGDIESIFPITEAAWLYLKPPYPTDLFEIMYIDNGLWQSFIASDGYGGVCNAGSLWWWNSSVTLCTSDTVNFYTWTFVAFSVNSTDMRACINTQCVSKSISVNSPAKAVESWNIGGPYHQYFNGFIANFQVYNT
ncbi:MAG: LamG-like jellyroll fold domain-containing protein, partial [Candidatus Micrarchaeia archaeon]